MNTEADFVTMDNLKQLRIWHNWVRVANDEGDITKKPISCTGGSTGASPNFSNTWCDYVKAEDTVNEGKANGVGLVLSPVNDNLALAGIDIDHKRLDDFIVQDIMQKMNTYAEKSPSGEGIHLLFLVETAKLPPNLKDVYYQKNPHNQVECYVGGLTNRFFTFTGNVIEDKPLYVRTQEVLDFLNTYMPRNVDYKNSIGELEKIEVTESNDKIIVPTDNKFVIDAILNTKQAEKFDKLFNIGDISDYNGDESSADMALATMLAFYIGNDFNRIDNLMQQSALYRNKWDRPDYKKRTIEKAIANCEGNFYHWSNEQIEENSNYHTKIETLTAKELMELNLPPLEPIVDNMLYPGFSILAGSPKVGKSWFCIALCLAVAEGEKFLISDTHKAECLYLALEDSINRIQSRLTKVLGLNQTAPEGFHITTSCNTLDEGLLSELQNTLNENHNIKLIIIDTLQKVRGNTVRGETWYASDYKEIAKLKKFADINKVCILAIHHLRKQKDTDVFNQISGSTGITGAADTMIVLNKMENGTGEVMMSTTGRDVDETQNILRFNKNTFKWEVASASTDIAKYKQQLSYEKNPIVVTIKKLVEEHPEGVTITATDLLRKIHEITGIIPKQNKAQTLSREINESLQFLLSEFDGIYYEPPKPNGGASGRKMYFALDENKKKLLDISSKF